MSSIGKILSGIIEVIMAIVGSVIALLAISGGCFSIVIGLAIIAIPVLAFLFIIAVALSIF